MVKQKNRKPWARALAGILSAAMVVTMAPDMALNANAAFSATTKFDVTVDSGLGTVKYLSAAAAPADWANDGVEDDLATLTAGEDKVLTDDTNVKLWVLVPEEHAGDAALVGADVDTIVVESGTGLTAGVVTFPTSGNEYKVWSVPDASIPEGNDKTLKVLDTTKRLGATIGMSFATAKNESPLHGAWSGGAVEIEDDALAAYDLVTDATGKKVSVTTGTLTPDAGYMFADEWSVSISDGTTTVTDTYESATVSDVPLSTLFANETNDLNALFVGSTETNIILTVAPVFDNLVYTLTITDGDSSTTVKVPSTAGASIDTADLPKMLGSKDIKKWYSESGVVVDVSGASVNTSALFTTPTDPAHTLNVSTSSENDKNFTVVLNGLQKDDVIAQDSTSTAATIIEQNGNINNKTSSVTIGAGKTSDTIVYRVADYSQTIVAPKVTRDHQIFKGWAVTPGGTVVKAAGQSLDVDEPGSSNDFDSNNTLTFYAVFTPITYKAMIKDASGNNLLSEAASITWPTGSSDLIRLPLPDKTNQYMIGKELHNVVGKKAATGDYYTEAADVAEHAANMGVLLARDTTETSAYYVTQATATASGLFKDETFADSKGEVAVELYADVENVAYKLNFVYDAITLNKFGKNKSDISWSPDGTEVTSNDENGKRVKYTPAADKKSITFTCNSDAQADAEYVTLPFLTASTASVNFTGWSRSSGQSEADDQLALSDPTTATAYTAVKKSVLLQLMGTDTEMTLYACTEAKTNNKKYTVTVNLDGGEITATPLNGWTLNSSKTAYVHEYYDTDVDGTNIAANITFPTADNLKKDGYHLDGLYEMADPVAHASNNGIANVHDLKKTGLSTSSDKVGDYTYTAVWVPNKITVDLVAGDGGSLTPTTDAQPDDAVIIYGENSTLTEIGDIKTTNAGGTFVGWVARKTAEPQWTVQSDPAKPTLIESVDKEANEAAAEVTKAKTLLADGAAVSSDYIDKYLNVSYVTTAAVTDTDSRYYGLDQASYTATLYGAWQMNTYTVTYNLGVGTGVAQNVSAKNYSLSTDKTILTDTQLGNVNNYNPTQFTPVLSDDMKKLYTFDHWEIDGEALTGANRIDFTATEKSGNTYPAGNYTVEAKYKPIVYSLNYYVGGNTSLTDEIGATPADSVVNTFTTFGEYSEDATISIAGGDTLFNNTGYTFNYWTFRNDGGKKFYTGDTTSVLDLVKAAMKATGINDLNKAAERDYNDRADKTAITKPIMKHDKGGDESDVVAYEIWLEGDYTGAKRMINYNGPAEISDQLAKLPKYYIAGSGVINGKTDAVTEPNFVLPTPATDSTAFYYDGKADQKVVDDDMAIEGKTFDKWYTTSSYDDDTAVTKVPYNSGETVNLYARYVDDVYYIGTAKDASTATTALSETKKEEPNLPDGAYEAEAYAYTATLPENSAFDAPEGQEFRGWNIAGNTKYVLTPGTTVKDAIATTGTLIKKGTYTTRNKKVDGAGSFAMVAAEEEITNANKNATFLTPVFNYPYTINFYDIDGEALSGQSMEFREGVALPTDVLAKDGHVITGWYIATAKADGTYTVNKSTSFDAGDTTIYSKLASYFEWTDSDHTAKALTLAPKYEKAYTINITADGNTIRTLNLSETQMGGTTKAKNIDAGETTIVNLKDAVAEAIDGELKADGKTVVAIAALSKDEFSPYDENYKEGYSFQNKVLYDGITKAVDWSTLKLTTLKARIDKIDKDNKTEARTIDVAVEFTENTYIVYAASNTLDTANINKMNRYSRLGGAAKTYKYTDVIASTVLEAAAKAYEKNDATSTVTGWKVYYADGNGTDFTNVNYIGVIDRASDVTQLSPYRTDYVVAPAVTKKYVKLLPQTEGKTYTITFDGNAADAATKGATVTGSMAKAVVKADDINTLTSGFSAEGLYVKTWKTKKGTTYYVHADGTAYTGGGDQVTLGDIVVAEGGDTTLTAQWDYTEYTLYYKYEGGAADTTDTFTIKAQKELATPSNYNGGSNYTFDGWYTDAAHTKKLELKAGSSSKYVLPAKYAKDITVYAGWKPAEYTLTLNANGGKGDDVKVKQSYGVPTKLPKNTFTNEGYVFAGWSATKQTAGGTNLTTDVADQGEYSITKNQTLYSVWAKSGTSKFEVKLILPKDATLTDATGWTTSTGTVNGESVAIFTQKYTTGGDAIKLPAGAARDNYTWKGWVDDETKKSVKSVSKSAVGSKSFTGVYEGKKFTVTYVANAPEGLKAKGKMDKQTVTYGSDWAPAECGFEVANYTFSGWTVGETTTVLDPASYTISKYEYTENLTLKANWKAKEDMTVQLYLNTTAATVNSAKINHAWGAMYNYTYAATDLTNGKLTLPGSGEISYGNLTLKGWKKAKVDNAGQPIEDDANETYKTTGKVLTSVVPTEDEIYVAQWSGKVNITYHNGIDTATQTVALGANKALKAINKKPMKGWVAKGEKFAGWSVANGNNTPVYKNKQKVKFLLSQTDVQNGAVVVDLYAVIDDAKADSTITLIGPDGVTIDTLTKASGKSITKKTLQAIGKDYAAANGRKFGAWYVYDTANNQRTDRKIKSLGKKVVGDYTLVLRYKDAAARKVKVSFDVNAAAAGNAKLSAIKTKTVKNTARVIKVGTLKVKGYRLAVWRDVTTSNNNVYAVKNGYIQNPYYEDGGAYDNVSSITLKAVWVADGTYNYYYDLNEPAGVGAITDPTGRTMAPGAARSAKMVNESQTMYKQYFTPGTSKLLRASLANYTFAGWEELQPNGTWKATSAEITGASVRYLRATWKALGSK